MESISCDKEQDKEEKNAEEEVKEKTLEEKDSKDVVEEKLNAEDDSNMEQDSNEGEMSVNGEASDGPKAANETCDNTPVESSGFGNLVIVSADISWSSKRWLKGLLNELSSSKLPKIKLYCDNKSAISLATNSGYKGRTKHIDACHHFVQERICAGDIEVLFITTTEIVADCLTKALPHHKLDNCVSAFGLCE